LIPCARARASDSILAAAAEARAEKQAADFTERLAAEKARTEKAIAAFASLAIGSTPSRPSGRGRGGGGSRVDAPASLFHRLAAWAATVKEAVFSNC
jgi:hypothetical protein